MAAELRLSGRSETFFTSSGNARERQNKTAKASRLGQKQAAALEVDPKPYSHLRSSNLGFQRASRAAAGVKAIVITVVEVAA